MSIAGFDIRRGRCRRRGIKSTAASSLVGQSMDTTSGYYQEINSAYLPGVSTGFTRWALIYIPSSWTAPGASEVYWSYRAGTGTRSWIMRVTSAGALDCYAADSFPSNIFSGSHTITAADKGKFHLVHMVASDTDNNIRMYVDAQDKGVGGAWSSYTAPTTGDALAIGAIGGGTFPTATIQVVAVGGTDSVVATKYQCYQHYVATQSAGTGVAMGLTGELWWNVDSAANAPTTWTDETSTTSLTKSGTIAIEDNAVVMYDLALANVGVTSSANVYAKAPGDTVFNGSSSMTMYMTGVSKTKTATAWPGGNNYIAGKCPGSVVRGWNVRQLNAGKPYIRGEFANGSGVLTATPNADFSTVTNGDLMTCVIKLGSNVARIYKQGVEVGTGTACTGYTSPSAADQMLVHAISSFYNRDWLLLGFGFCGSVAASDAEISAWHAACLADPNGIAAMGLSGEILFRGEDVPTAGNWVDTGSVVTLTETGTVAHDYPINTWS